MSGEITPGSNIDFGYIINLLSLAGAQQIKVPTGYRNQVLAVKKLLNDDISGLANSILDFAIENALVDYNVQAESGAKAIYNDWLDNVNLSLSEQIPVGIRGLAKQYFKERWKGSSNLVLVTRWEEVNDYRLPTIMYFIDGEDVVAKKNKGHVSIGKTQYSIRVSNNPKDNIVIPKGKDEKIFIQKPYESWGALNPVPFIIKRGLYRNIIMLELLTNKGQDIVAKALEYLLLMKKGDKELAKMNKPEFIYNKEELTNAKEGLKKVVADSKLGGGIPTYATNFDTDLSHFIPDYSKIIDGALYSPFEKRVLQGLGMIEVIQGTSSTRKESILNPKPFISEVYSGIGDFNQLLTNVIYAIREENRSAHRKFSSTKVFMKDNLVQAFLSMDDKTIIRGIYDRGNLSRETYVELSGDVNFEIQVQKRKEEKKKGLEVIMFPQSIQNTDTDQNPNSNNPDKEDIKDKNENENKDGPEKKNFTQSKENFKCPHCESKFDFESQIEIRVGCVECPNCKGEVEISSHHTEKKKKTKSKEKSKTQKKTINKSDLELSIYKTNKDLPDSIKDNLPKGAQTIFRKAFNSVMEDDGDEVTAIKIAWNAVKKSYEQNKDGKWVKIKASKEESSEELSEEEKTENKNKMVDEAIKLQELELNKDKGKLIKKLLKEKESKTKGEVNENI